MSILSSRLTNLAFYEAEPSGLGSLEDMFSEEPVSLETFLYDKKFLNSPPLGPRQLEPLVYAERIYLPETYPLLGQQFPYWAQPVRQVNFLTLQYGKGAGKDMLARIMGLRIAYLLTCLINPKEYFGLPADDTIHLLNIASSSDQASRAYFAPMARMVKHGWFKDHCDPKPGAGLIDWDKGIQQISGHSDAETQEGLNLILGVADEIDAFKTTTELARYHGKSKRPPSKSADVILRMLRTSSSTRFPETFKNVRISYPRYLGSTIQLLTEEAKKDNQEYPETSRHYVAGPLATWEVNPRIKGKEAFREDYRENPVMAAAMYECRPSRAIEGYFRQIGIFDACVYTTDPSVVIDYTKEFFTSEHTGYTTEIWSPSFALAPALIPRLGSNYVIHADLAIKGDRAGVCLAHVDRWETRTNTITLPDGSEETSDVTMPVVVVDAIFGFEADIGENPPREIQIRWIREFVYRLIARNFHVAKVTYDGFQSYDSRQILEMHGIETERVSTDLKPELWQTLRDLATDRRLELPFDQLLWDELSGLSRFGDKIDHQFDGSKDLADALACAVSVAVIAGGSYQQLTDYVFNEPDTDYTPEATAHGWDSPMVLPSLPDDSWNGNHFPTGVGELDYGYDW